MSKFKKDTGIFIPLASAAKLTKNYRVDQLERKKHKDPVMSQFFGIDKLNELLSQEGAIGLRIYYGLDIDGDGKVDKHFVLTATDADGEDILPAQTRSVEMKAAANTGTLITDGFCPFDCPKVANPLNSDIE
ncbi:hypothetical protein ACQKLP_15020 [Chitinophaga sp. NPDC101104]|uniref:hypothetical protein n=1 Tax=Chitinophaga sp. NPDC101104 TaxID=3390561 RepID=UPI003CFCB4CC